MNQKKSYVGIKNSADNSALELFFTDFIFDGFDWSTFEETNMVQDTIDKVRAANPSKIKVTINSLGGDVMIGLALYNFLKDYDAKVEVKVIGFAGSIASIIAMCANKGKLSMGSTSFMIIHAASSIAFGNAKEMRDQAEVLDKITNELAGIYAQRSGKEVSFFTDMWADGGDVWLTAKEAKEMGLADELINAAPVTARVDIASFGYKNIPTALITNTIKQNTMAFQKTIIAAKAESFGVTDEGFLLQEEMLNNIEAEVTRLQGVEAELGNANTSITNLTNNLATANKSIETLTAAAGVNATRIKELEAEVITLGKKPSGAGTALTTEKDENAETAKVPVYLDDNSPENLWADKQMRRKKEAV